MTIAETWGAGLPDELVLQRVVAVDDTQQSNTALTPNDDTVPQVGEGWQALEASINPLKKSSRLRVTIILAASASATGRGVFIHLHRDGAANAVAGWQCNSAPANGGGQHQEFLHEEATNSLASTTFQLHLGLDAAATAYTNGDASGRHYGGTMTTTMIIEEIAA